MDGGIDSFKRTRLFKKDYDEEKSIDWRKVFL